MKDFSAVESENRMDHAYIIFGESEEVVERAKRESWTAFVINKKLFLLNVLEQVLQKEEKIANYKLEEHNVTDGTSYMSQHEVKEEFFKIKIKYDDLHEEHENYKYEEPNVSDLSIPMSRNELKEESTEGIEDAGIRSQN